MLAFVSDVHLTEPHTKKYEVFLSFLENCKDNKDLEQLFLVGDIFDVWLGHKSFFLKKHEQLLLLLQEIAKTKKVHIFEGNHDFHYNKNWFKKKSILIHKDSYEFVYEQKKWFVCHGDLLNSKDYGYRFFRAFMRTSFIKLLIWLLPGQFSYKVGRMLSSTDAKTQKDYSSFSKEEFIKKWKIWTSRLRQKKDFDVFVCGHYHVRLTENLIFEKEVALNNKRQNTLETYNLGSWLGKSFKYLRVDKKKSEFITINK